LDAHRNGIPPSAAPGLALPRLKEFVRTYSGLPQNVS